MGYTRLLFTPSVSVTNVCGEEIPAGLLTIRSKVTVLFVVTISRLSGEIVNETTDGIVGTSA